jgi:hypothetical protein
MATMVGQQSNYVLGLNQSSGSIGLWLYFAGRISALHQRQGLQGRIELANGGPLGGGDSCCAGRQCPVYVRRPAQAGTGATF